MWHVVHIWCWPWSSVHLCTHEHGKQGQCRKERPQEGWTGMSKNLASARRSQLFQVPAPFNNQLPSFFFSPFLLPISVAGAWLTKSSTSPYGYWNFKSSSCFQETISLFSKQIPKRRNVTGSNLATSGQVSVNMEPVQQSQRSCVHSSVQS